MAGAAARNLFEGAYGAVVARPFKRKDPETGEIVTVTRGLDLTPDDLARYPFTTRRALVSGGFIVMHTRPAADADGGSVLAKAAPADPDLGKFGGVTLSEMRFDRMQWPAGVRLTPETVMAWPLKNRIALREQGRVAFFTEPVAFEVSEAEKSFIDDQLMK